MRKVVNKKVIVLAVLAGVACGVAFVLALPPDVVDSRLYAWQQRRMVNRVMHSDPQVLLAAGRQLFASRRFRTGDISLTDSDIPATIRRLHPTQIHFATNYVSVDFSDAFNPFGFIVFAPDSRSNETQYLTKWIEGLWLFDDGQLEEYKANHTVERTRLTPRRSP